MSLPPGLFRPRNTIQVQNLTIPEDSVIEPTFPCSNCGRKFIRSSLGKHESACKKLATLHRKPFDSGKQRATGSDISYDDVKRAQREKAKVGGVFPRPQTNWKERHGNFIDAVSSSKRVDYALKTGAPLPPPPRTAVPSDYVQCEYCGRNFNAQAAERHIPFCREQSSRKQPNSRSLSQSRMAAANIKNLPTKHEGKNRDILSRDSSPSRHSSTRTRDGSLSRNRSETADELKQRRRSVETRSSVNTLQTRNTSFSAGNRPGTLPPSSREKRSTSASRSSAQHRIKTP
ncbi:unnamed protein product [Caenorhabditis bovis]|uniref:C2HC/C3H-type domain-containing protein n=1 Tax=Caenorhabditis bovis TaxID=2654633 RepID=A0A8S1EK77_9PELO|nr:unnamed protein product [Caenorhabditis bovis]